MLSEVENGISFITSDVVLTKTVCTEDDKRGNK